MNHAYKSKTMNLPFIMQPESVVAAKNRNDERVRSSCSHRALCAAPAIVKQKLHILRHIA